METDTSSTAGTGSGSDGAAASEGPANTRRKLTEQQELEVTHLYAETETPVSEISKRFGIGESSVYRVAQRHGASLRGRTGAAAGASSARASGGSRSRRAASGAAGSSGRGRRPRTTAGSTSASGTGGRRRGRPATASGPAGTGNGRRRGGRATAAGATSGRRSAAATPGRRAAPASGGHQFSVSYIAVRTFTAADMADAIRQAQAAGARDITGIQRAD